MYEELLAAIHEAARALQLLQNAGWIAQHVTLEQFVNGLEQFNATFEKG